MNARGHHEQVADCDVSEGGIALYQFGQVVSDGIVDAVDVAFGDGNADESGVEGFGHGEGGDDAIMGRAVEIFFIQNGVVLDDEEGLGVSVCQELFQVAIDDGILIELGGNGRFLHINCKLKWLGTGRHCPGGELLIIIHISIAPAQYAQRVFSWIKKEGIEKREDNDSQCNDQ